MTILAGPVHQRSDLRASGELQRVEEKVTTHVGEILQGQFSEGRGQVRALLSAGCSALSSTAVYEPDRSGSIHVVPATKTKARAAAYLTRDHLGARWLGGVMRISSNIPPRRGGGESTGDALAAAKAVARAVGVNVDAHILAHICVVAEQASDSVMFDHAVLFAHRVGIVIEDFGARVPRGTVLAFDAAPESDGVDTLQLTPAAYNSDQVAEFDVLRTALRRAIELQNIDLLARVSTASATINERFLPNPSFGVLRELVQRGVAHGLLVAHSGTLAGAIFAPGEDDQMAEAQRVLDRSGIRDFFTFGTAERQAARSAAA